ncbi:TadE/TadG family type IV pilus assembly protein [Mesorhizobium sp. CAU 1732]|uniref:TadE/TadG family type IV pilus assembly protein n=1 Tax=Mesorhizobium sp. CAU 1732 TaxID=3140358 RepID=UPI0032609DE4
MFTQLRLNRVFGFAVSTRGATAVEFAVLMPVYLLLLLGMTAYGIYFGASHSVQQISADTARAALAGITAEERKALALDFVDRHASGYLFIDRAKLTIEAADSQQGNGQFNVTVRYDASELPIWNLVDRLAMPSQTILRRSTIRIGGI